MQPNEPRNSELHQLIRNRLLARNPSRQRSWDLFRSRLHYAGLSREEYRALLPGVFRDNANALHDYARIAVIFFFVLWLVSLLSHNFAAHNTLVYLVSFGVGLLFCILARLCRKRNSPALTRLVMYLFMLMLYGFSFALVCRQPDKTAVTTIVLMVLIPLLFTDRPVNLILLSLGVIVAFCTLTTLIKEPPQASVDRWNAVSFGFLAMVAETLIMRMKFNSWYQAEQIRYLSETDLLTGVHNRNSFEQRILSCPEKEAFVCIYLDANDLHSINNRFGHDAGDEMLRFVAAQLLDSFGAENVFRIGGDEFVVLQKAETAESVKACIDPLLLRIEDAGYSVSYGLASTDAFPGLQETIRAAESAMYKAKSEHYRETRFDRRSSR